MKFEMLHYWPEVQRLQPAWQELLAVAATGSVHGSPEWVESWMTTLGRLDQPRFVTAWENGQLVGLLPLVIARSSWAELGGKRLQFVGGRRGDYHDVLVAAGREAEVVPRLVHEALTMIRQTGLLVFHHLPEDSPSLPILRTMLAVDGLVCREVATTAPYLILDRSLPSLAEQWRKSHRDDLRRQRRHLEKLGSLSFTIHQKVKEILRQLPGFFDAHRRCYLGRGRKSLPGNDLRTQDFLQTLVVALGCENPVRRVHFATLDLDGKAIAYHLGFISGQVFLYYLPTYEPELEQYSPGKVLLHHLIEHGFAHESWQVFDFMRGAEPYKYRWTKTERTIYDLVATPRFSTGAIRRWWLSVGKERARRWLVRVRPS